jgi:hypothetical protein
MTFEEAWTEFAKTDKLVGCNTINAMLKATFAFGWAARDAELIEREAELIYLRKYGKDGALWSANESKDVWRAMARKALGMVEE